EAFLRPDPIAAALAKRGGRYLTVDRGHWTLHGYFGNDALLGSQQSMVFGLREAQGYNTVQLKRFWEYVRAADRHKHVRYSSDYFRSPGPAALDLLQVAWVVAPPGRPPPFAVPQPVAVTADAALYRVADAAPMASVYRSWHVVRSPGAALAGVSDAASFDPT